LQVRIGIASARELLLLARAGIHGAGGTERW
jgi:hypothetical protein